MGDNEEAKALYVGNLHPYVNEAVLQVRKSPVSYLVSLLASCHRY